MRCIMYTRRLADWWVSLGCASSGRERDLPEGFAGRMTALVGQSVTVEIRSRITKAVQTAGGAVDRLSP